MLDLDTLAAATPEPGRLPVGRAFGEADEARGPLADPIVARVEAPREAEATVEDEGDRDGRGRVAARRQQRRERRELAPEAVDRIVADTVSRRVEARHERRVGRQGEGSRRQGRGEANSIGGDGVLGLGVWARA